MDESVSFWVGNYSSTTHSEITLVDFFNGIRDGKWKGVVEQFKEKLQLLGKYNSIEFKQKIPHISACGLFSRYKDDTSIIKHSGYFCVDIDNLKEHTFWIKSQLAKDPYCISTFISPSGNGIKFFMKCNPFSPHEETHNKIVDYFKNKYDLSIDGPAQRYLMQMCYASYDPEIFVNKEPKNCPILE